MKFDVLIIGGGLVGASLALAFKGSGLKVALVESRHPSPLPADDSWDSRIYAISPGSAAFLQNLGVWQALKEDRITPVYNMAVFGDDNAARIDFSAYDIGCPELAFIVENRQLQTAVWNALKRQKKHVTIFCPAKCTSVVWNESHVDLHLDDGNVLQAALIVGADGLNSWVRTQAEIEVLRHSYQQMGVVANFETERAHKNVAYQWFRRDGVMALLPLPGKMVSMVWSAEEERAHALLGLSETELCRQVTHASYRTLGEMQLVTRPAAFPLNFVHVKEVGATASCAHRRCRPWHSPACRTRRQSGLARCAILWLPLSSRAAWNRIVAITGCCAVMNALARKIFSRWNLLQTAYRSCSTTPIRHLFACVIWGWE